MKKLSSPLFIPKKPTFRGYETDRSVSKYERNLPHLRLEGATYFVTFRLADSIPKNIMKRWTDERDEWLSYHGIDPKLNEQSPLWQKLYFSIPEPIRYEFEKSNRRRFFLELNKCHGSCILRHLHGIVAQALEYFHSLRVWLGDYVIMPNHVHLLVQPFSGVKLEDWLYSIKRFSAYQMNKQMLVSIQNTKREIWRKESYDRIVRNISELAHIRKYMVKNFANLPKEHFSYKKMTWLDDYAPI